VQRVRYATGDVDEATELLHLRCSDYRPLFSGTPDEFALEFAADSVSTCWGRIGIDRVRHTRSPSMLTEPCPVPTVVAPNFGRVRCTGPREQTADGPRLAPSGPAARAHRDDIEIVLGSLDPDGLRLIGAEVSGLTPSEVTFTGMCPITPAHGGHVAATLTYLQRDVLANDAVMTSPIVRGQAFYTLATALLAAFPNTTHTLDAVRRDRDAEPATVRRAVEFVDANAHRDIGLTEIAKAARLGVRCLQLAFRRHRDTTPMAHLKRVRIGRAHRDLQAGDHTAGDTVATIAARWGFTHGGAFAADYRRLYGCSPSHTLRR
jgi:AraC-like DNA-binding protein